ncbi:MAG: serine dehydratase subunit alpha family protein [Clostridia bacterium]|nr:serine dehydratase subunit alpha family protein [Clostridia bacterium]
MLGKAFLEVLDRELVIALGCTEPIAIAYASAMATKHLKGDLLALEVYASGNIIKNAMGVHIPGTGKTGMNLAAALGSLSDADKNLEVLCGIKEEDIEKAQEMIEEGRISIRKSDHPKKLYIEVIAKSEASSSRVVIEDRHTNITRIETDSKVFFSVENKIDELPVNDTSFMSMESIWAFVENVDVLKLSKVEETIKVNKRIGEEGILHEYGLKVGKTIYESMEKGHQVMDPTNYAMALTAAGSDARMAGSSFSVMSNSGSGNQGITATLPVIAYWEKLGLSHAELLRAVTLSHLVTIYIKTKFGRLSALCGATIAATGASCGITYLQGGKKEAIYASVQNMLGNVTGMLCDGAKGGCALKVATCTSAACLSSSLALNGIAIGSHDGIIDQNPEKTIENLCLLSMEGGLESDRIILDIMLEKENKLMNN